MVLESGWNRWYLLKVLDDRMLILGVDELNRWYLLKVLDDRMLICVVDGIV